MKFVKTNSCNDAESLSSFVWGVLLPFRWHILGQVFTIIIWALDISLRPYALKLLLDRIAGFSTDHKDLNSLWEPVILYLGMFFLVNVSFRLYDYFVYRRNPEIKKSIIQLMVTRLMSFSSYFFQNHMAGGLANKINDIANGIPLVLTIVIDRFFGQILVLLIAVYATTKVGSVFSFFLMGWVTIIILTMSVCVKKAKTISIKTAEAWTDVVGQVVDVLSNISSVRFFVGKNLEQKITDTYLNKAVVAEQAYFGFAIRAYSALGIAFIIFQALCLALLIIGVKNGQISVGDFYLILTLNIAISDQLFLVTQDVAQFSEHLGKVVQGYSIISSPQEIRDKPDAQDLVVTKGEIVFEDIVFSYKNTNSLFFNEKVVIKAGEKVGLVGHSGSGKSTFVNLILRLFELQSGRILIDGQNISKVTQDSLRRAIAIVPQDMPLFHRTLLENIRYGRCQASDEEVVQAAQKAHAHDFIMATPLGYATMVGDRGSKLSGGQRQRIAIARAVLKNAPILIFDEATSALDSMTEGLIQDSLWELMQGRTTIVVAHKLATLQWMDRILVFDKGCIVEEGTHAELSAKEGVYKDMWDAQVGSFIQKEESTLAGPQPADEDEE
jgi:ATP-binding cassette subfamily B protein